MGRCQGGFCASKVLDIMARELKAPKETLTKNGRGSEILISENRLKRDTDLAVIDGKGISLKERYDN
jgi:hypothetical protein